MYNMSLPWWGWALMAAGFVCFVLMVALSVRRHHGVKRSLFASPYTLWMIIFTVLPCILVAYYAFTDANGAFTLDNFRHFWDSNYTKNQLYAQMGPEAAAFISRGTVNVDTLVYSLWMAFLCTLISLLLGYPAALYMADRNMKIGSTIVVLFIIPMWMNFLLRTIAWMSLLEDQGLINNFLRLLGFEGVQLMYNSGAVLLGMFYNFLPFMVFPHLHVAHQAGPAAGRSRAGPGLQCLEQICPRDRAAQPAGRDQRHYDGLYALGHHLLHPPHSGRRKHHDVRRPDRKQVPHRGQLECG